MEARTFPLPKGQTLTIRLAEPDDAEQVVDHFTEAGGESDNLPFGAGEFGRTPDELRGDIEASRKAENALFAVAVVEDVIAGVITLTGGKRPRTRHLGEFGITVRESHWGRGIGQHLMKYMIDYAQTSGVIRQIRLVVRADHTVGIALYEKMGFVKEGRKSRALFINGAFVDNYVMGLPIDPLKGAE